LPLEGITFPIKAFTGFILLRILRSLETERLYLWLSSAGKGWSPMLWTIVVLLLILWLLGMVSSYTLGGLIHILLVVAIIVVLVRIIQGRSPVA